MYTWFGKQYICQPVRTIRTTILFELNVGGDRLELMQDNGHQWRTSDGADVPATVISLMMKLIQPQP